MVSPQGIRFCGLWPNFRAFVAPFVDMWGSKSQVLSTSFWRGLHFLRFEEPNRDIGRFRRDLARAARDFFKDFDVLVPKIHKNAGPQGLMLTLGSSHRMCGPCARAFVAHLLFVVG